MNLIEQLRGWSTGPLPDQELELAAWRLFSVSHPSADWADNIWHDTRNAFRAEVVKLALLPWTLSTALDLLTEQSIRLTFGDREIGPELRQEIRNYAESYLEDLWPVVGRPAMTIGGIARNNADLRLMAARQVS